MEYLISGLMLWSVVHFFPALFPAGKRAFIWRFGQISYMVVFTLFISASLLLIVLGWSRVLPVFLYYLSDLYRILGAILIAIGFIFFVASKLPTNIKQVIRHPQLAGVIFWGVGHLLLNGDVRSVLLFTWFTVWAVLEVLLISRREEEWIKPERASWLQDISCVVVGFIVFNVVIFAHPYLTGIALR